MANTREGVTLVKLLHLLDTLNPHCLRCFAAFCFERDRIKSVTLLSPMAYMDYLTFAFSPTSPMLQS